MTVDGHLVVGGRGLIGSALVALLVGEGRDVRYTTRSLHLVNMDPRALYLDLLEPAAELPALPHRCPAVYLIAGASGVFSCERNPDTWRANADAPRALAYQARARGWPVVYLSTGAVELAPHTAYAMQRAAVEAVVLATGGAVVRPRGRVTERTVVDFARFVAGAAGQSGVRWWEGE